MPIDYDSFLAGVWTGLRLGRVPGGRRPPTPVPSGKYILTESGEIIITEQLDWDGITIIKTGVWYELETPFLDGEYLFTQVKYSVYMNGTWLPAKFFYSYYIDTPNNIDIVAFTDDYRAEGARTFRLSIAIRTDDEYEGGGASYLPQNVLVTPDGIYYGRDFQINEYMVSGIRKMFADGGGNDLKRFMESRTRKPMITE